ncbi:MAG: hypothetical protein AB7O74_03150 [Candidatus Nanopelagicales bacterium]
MTREQSWFGGFRTNLVRDAGEEGVSARAAWGAFWAPFVGLAVFVVLYVVARDLYYWLLREDHVIEWLQFFLLVFTCIVSVIGAVAAFRRGHRLTGAFLLLVALGTLFLAGEEISWGQRILGLAGDGNNRQGELNIHNIDDADGIPVEKLFRIAQAAIGFIGVVLPFLVRWSPARLRGASWRVITPPIFLATSFLVVLGFRTQRLLFTADISALIVIQEWAEVCLYGALATWVTLTWLEVSGRRERTDQGTTSLRAGTGRTAVVVAAVVGVLTIVCVVLTMASGIEPGNV